MSENKSARDITADLSRRLRVRHDGRDSVVLFGVGDGAEFRNRGWSDAIAMSIWPSRGLAITGYEVKASRPDWLRELDNIGKNKTWQETCHEWYIVAPKDVVAVEELPRAWGLMIPRGEDKLRIVSRSERDGNGAKSVPLDLMAAVFRAAQNERTRDRANERDAIRAELSLQHRERRERLERDLVTANDRYNALATALGGRWNGVDELVVKAKAVAACDLGVLRRRLRECGDRLRAGEKTIALIEGELERFDGSGHS